MLESGSLRPTHLLDESSTKRPKFEAPQVSSVSLHEESDQTSAHQHPTLLRPTRIGNYLHPGKLFVLHHLPSSSSSPTAHLPPCSTLNPYPNPTPENSTSSRVRGVPRTQPIPTGSIARQARDMIIQSDQRISSPKGQSLPLAIR
jgi:hypothetical protein